MNHVLTICFTVLIVAVLLALYRLLKGPTVIDRILAFDAIAVCVVGMIVLLSVKWSSSFYLEVVLIFSLLGFVSTVALASYLYQTEPRHPDANSGEEDVE